MRLPLAMIGVLPQDDDADLVERRQVERAEPLGRAGEDTLAAGALLGQEGLQRLHIGLVELGLQHRQPAFVQSNIAHHFVLPFVTNARNRRHG